MKIFAPWPSISCCFVILNIPPFLKNKRSTTAARPTLWTQTTPVIVPFNCAQWISHWTVFSFPKQNKNSGDPQVVYPCITLSCKLASKSRETKRQIDRINVFSSCPCFCHSQHCAYNRCRYLHWMHLSITCAGNPNEPRRYPGRTFDSFQISAFQPICFQVQPSALSILSVCQTCLRQRSNQFLRLWHSSCCYFAEDNLGLI